MFSHPYGKEGLRLTQASGLFSHPYGKEGLRLTQGYTFFSYHVYSCSPLSGAPRRRTTNHWLSTIITHTWHHHYAHLRLIMRYTWTPITSLITSTISVSPLVPFLREYWLCFMSRRYSCFVSFHVSCIIELPLAPASRLPVSPLQFYEIIAVS